MNAEPLRDREVRPVGVIPELVGNEGALLLAVEVPAGDVEAARMGALRIVPERVDMASQSAIRASAGATYRATPIPAMAAARDARIARRVRVWRSADEAAISRAVDRSSFIIETQKAAWLLYSSNREGMTFRCGAPGCREAIFVPDSMIQKGEIPDACDRLHVEAEGAPIESYADAMRVIADARRRLGIDQSDAGAAAGLTDGHVNKLEAGWRCATLPVLLALAATMGFRVVLAPAPVPRQTAAAVEGRSMRPMMERWRLIPARRLGEDRPARLFRLIPAQRLDEGEAA